MDIVLLVGRLLLAAVFAVAGFAKFADRVSTRQTILNFGIPIALARPLTSLLPLAEIAVAMALLVTGLARWGAAGALALLVLFTVGIGVNLGQGRTPACRCFGQFHSTPIGRKTLGRNALLASVAGFVVWEGWDGAGASLFGWVDELTLDERIGPSSDCLPLSCSRLKDGCWSIYSVGMAYS